MRTENGKNMEQKRGIDASRTFFRSSASAMHAEFLSRQADDARRRGDVLEAASCDVFSRVLKHRAERETRHAAREFVENFLHRN